MHIVRASSVSRFKREICHIENWFFANILLRWPRSVWSIRIFSKDLGIYLFLLFRYFFLFGTWFILPNNHSPIPIPVCYFVVITTDAVFVELYYPDSLCVCVCGGVCVCATSLICYGSTWFLVWCTIETFFIFYLVTW